MNRDRLIKKLPSLLCEGPTTRAENRRESQNNRARLLKLKRKNPLLLQHYVLRIDRDIEDFKQVLRSPIVPKKGFLEKLDYGLRTTEFEFPLIDGFLEKRKKGRRGS